MNDAAFRTQIDRLKEVYGEKAYPVERMKIMFNAVKAMPDYWMESSVNEFIGNHRQAPLLEAFLKKIDEHREKERYDNAHENRSGVSGFGKLGTSLGEAALYSANQSFSKACTSLIRKKQEGKINYEDFLHHCDLLDEAAQELDRKCPDCADEGYMRVRDDLGAPVLYRCHCSVGAERARVAVGPPDASGVRKEYPMQQWRGEA